ncbi:MAG: hypothetical protein CME62_15200 [Halobacteriovoraceae bacterium]|nr:hypothetical protein [Halobacteriovoraceae bacterium]|tara:strand:+ start:15280 stop:15660 length:381 start_codon:yes stop_codon:yes gene_type:complete
MVKSDKHILILASVALGLAVLIGAFGAHGLEKIASAKALKTFQTGVQYHYYHGFALFILAIIAGVYKIDVQKPALLFLLGIFLFSFNCYLYAMTQVKTFAMIVPFGGVSFVAGWFTLAYIIKKGIR